MRGGMEQIRHDVFISYSRRDDWVVQKICNLLDQKGISYWVDKKN